LLNNLESYLVKNYCMVKRTAYKGKIIRQLFFSDGLSCSDLSNKLNKSLPFINSLLNELVEEGIVVETGYAPSSGGRRPLMYSLKTGIFYVLAVAMDQFVTRIALMDKVRFEPGRRQRGAS